MRLLRCAALAFVACSADPSPSTDELVVTFWVAQPDDDVGMTHHEATFVKEGRLFSLDEGDTIKVTSDAAPEGVLVSDRNPLGVTYTLDRDDPPFTTMTFALDRKNGGSAPRSTATFPLPLAGFLPANGTTLPYGDGSAKVRLTWTNAVPAGLITYVSHACDGSDNHVYSRDLPDKGVLELSMRDLVVAGAPTGPTCLHVVVRRGLLGTLDVAVAKAGSSITAYLVHTATVTITP